MRPLIVFLDDELRLVDGYIRELEFDYKVQRISDVDELLDFLATKTRNIKLLILDIMMIPGNQLSLEITQNGLKTGLVLYETIRKNNSELPIIIFTNVTQDEQNEIVKKINQDKKAKFLEKQYYLPFELLHEVQCFLL